LLFWKSNIERGFNGLIKKKFQNGIIFDLRKVLKNEGEERMKRGMKEGRRGRGKSRIRNG
jgi:hypothetical protein